MVADPPTTDSAMTTRTCGRCRVDSVLDAQEPGVDAQWWLCPPCREKLLGDTAKTSSRWA